MNRVTLLNVFKVCGDQTKAEVDRWKGISHLFIDNGRTIYNFKEKVESKEVIFVDKAVTQDGTLGRTTGFFILETLLPNTVGFNNTGTKHITFVDAEQVQGISFWNEGTVPITSLVDFIGDMYL